MIRAITGAVKGTWIFTITDGWVQVDSVNPDTIAAAGTTYMLDGKRNGRDIYPSAFMEDIFNGTVPPCGFIEGEIICVWNSTGEKNCKYEPFIRFNNVPNDMYYTTGTTDGKHICYWNNARKLTKEERGAV